MIGEQIKVQGEIMEVKKKLETGKITKLNQNPGSGILLKEPFESQVQDWIEEYD